MEQKRAALQQAELNLQYTKIVAPVTGQVNKRVVVGMNVMPGQQLLTIVPLQEVWVTANFKETQLGYVRPGLPVDLYVDSNRRMYKGHVDSIAGAAAPLFSLFPPESASGNYVKIVQHPRVRVDVRSTGLAQAYIRQLRLFEIRCDPDFVERNNSEQLLTGHDIHSNDDTLAHLTGIGIFAAADISTIISCRRQHPRLYQNSKLFSASFSQRRSSFRWRNSSSEKTS